MPARRHLGQVLAQDGAHDAVAIVEVVLEGDRVLGPGHPGDLAQADGVDAPLAEERLGGADDPRPGRFGRAHHGSRVATNAIVSYSQAIA